MPWQLVFSDDFNRALLGPNWTPEKAGTGADPDISVNRLRVRVTATQVGAYSRAIKTVQDDYGPTAIRAVYDVVDKGAWPADVRAAFGLKNPAACWYVGWSMAPNTGIRLIMSNKTTLWFSFFVAGVESPKGNQPVGAGNNHVEFEYNFITGAYTVRVDGVIKFSGVQVPLLPATIYVPFFGCYTYAQTIYDDNLNTYRWVPPRGVGSIVPLMEGMELI